MIQPWGFLPQAPFEYTPTFIGSFVGCNHLRCLKCKQPVLHLDDWEVASPNRFDGIALRTAVDMAELDWLKPTPDIAPRTYYCDCTFQEVASPVSLDPLDPDLEDRGIVLHWRCEGHPLPQPEDQLSGLTLGPLLEDPEVFRQFVLGQIQMDD